MDSNVPDHRPDGTEACCFCSTINDSKFVPTRIPAREGECPSLLQQCISKITSTPALLEPGQVRKLPVPVLEELKFYFTDDALFRLSDLFREKGIDSSPAWEVLLYKRFGYEYMNWVAPWSDKPVWKMAEDYHDPCQLYMAELCENLTKGATYETEQGSIEKKTCGPCFTKFSSYLTCVSSFVVSMRQLSWIVKADTDLSKALKSTLERIVDLDLNLFCKPKDTDQEAVDFVKQLIAESRLKSLTLGSLEPTTGKCNQLLIDLFSTDEAEDESLPALDSGETSEQMESEDESERRGFDLIAEALQMNNTTRMICLADLSDIRKRIRILKQSEGGTQEQQEALQSLQVHMLEGFFFKSGDNLVHFGKLLQAYKPIKRLTYTSRENHGWNALCAMVGAGRLTHLMVTGPHTVFFLLIAVLFENYRCDGGISQPMEFLGFYDVICAPPYDEGLLHYHHPVAAVKRLQLSKLDISVSMVSHLHLLLRYNTALTHLDLESVGMDAQLTLSSVFSAVSKHRTLESFNLSNSNPVDEEEGMFQFRTAKDEKALVSLLRTNPQLKNLVLEDCKVRQQFVSSDAFLKAVKNHKGLEHLSLSNNKLETAGVDLLLALREPLATSSLKGLGLDHCQIPGPELLEAARTISEGRPKGGLFLQYLSLCNNKVNKEELLELQRCFATCVRLPHIKGMWVEEEDWSDEEEEEEEGDGGEFGVDFGLEEWDTDESGSDEWDLDEEDKEEEGEEEGDVD